MNKKEDIRITKTKKYLYEGLLTLMKDKTFEEIKVSDICTIALINRSTFYDHFNDKFELLDSLINDLEKGLIEKLKENTKLSSSKEYYMETIKLFLDHAEENLSVYSAILKKNNNSIVMDMVYDTLLKDVQKHIEQDLLSSTIPSEIISKFYVSAVINVCLDYLKSPRKHKKEDIITYLDILLPNKIYK